MACLNILFTIVMPFDLSRQFMLIAPQISNAENIDRKNYLS